MMLLHKIIPNLAAVLVVCYGFAAVQAFAQADGGKDAPKPSKAEVMALLASPTDDDVVPTEAKKDAKAQEEAAPADVAKEAPKEEEAAEEKPPLNIPIPVGHKVKGIKIPYFNLQGVKQMEFYATVANRIDEERIELDNVRMETFTAEGVSDMVINLPKSIFYVAKQNIVSDTEVLIERSDFKIRGETMDFDTRTRKGKLIGKVHMIIYNKEGGVLAPKPSETE